MENLGLQTWSVLPTETVGDFRELGFVHGSNSLPAWGPDEFPHSDAARAYEVGFDFGTALRNPEAREYAAAEHGRNVGTNASPEQRAAIVRRLLNGSETLAWGAGRDFGLHEAKYKRSV